MICKRQLQISKVSKKMGDVKSILIQIFVLFLAASVNSQSWEEPYFIDAGTDGIEFLVDKENTTNLNVNEELGPSVFVVLNYQGDDEPQINLQNNFVQYFGPKIVKNNDNYWRITIDYSPDFERADLPDNIFRPEVTVNGVAPKLYVELKNLDDNEPEIIVDTAKCVVKEKEIIDMQECIYTVRDPDGCTNAVGFNVEDEGETFSLMLNGESAIYPDCLHKWKPITQSKYHLKVNEELDFETTRNYFLRAKVEDGAHQTGSNEIVVNVEDVADTPPQWLKSFSMVTVTEKESKSFQVIAKDGDTSINTKICYNLTVEDEGISEEEKKYFNIDEDSGTVTIGEIDRDKYQHNTYNLQIVAFECNDPDWATPTSISIVVQDKNDNSPTICAQEIVNGSPSPDCLNNGAIEISLEEEKPSTLDSFYIIGITDPDEGTAGTFRVALEDAVQNSEHWSDAFNVIPNQGYQDGKFTVSVADPSKLNYETEKWRNIQLKLVATEVADNTHVNEIPITINLTNVNDESPEFGSEDTLQVTVKENFPVNEIFYTLQATDKDGIEDVLTYGLVQAKGLDIDPSTGDIKTKENVFDFELQQQVIVQVFAQDSMGSENGGKTHKTFATLTINVEDVNDVAPQISLGVNAIDVEESLEPGNTLPDARIIATDVDTNSSLKYSIDWSQTTGRKNSVPVALEVFENSYEIDGVYENNEEFIATLTAAKKLSWNDIDTIKLFIVVEDEYTEEGYKSSSNTTLTINILDVNDHKPVFASCDKTLEVTENSDPNVKIRNGQILAEDEDGPDNNIIEYSIQPADNRITIDESGQLYTGDVFIDRDCEDCGVLSYTVVARNDGGPDGGTATCDISINVIDVNDNWPIVDEIEKETVNINEDAESGMHITNITSHDIDVSSDYNTITYSIDLSSNRNLNNFFKIINHEEGIGELVVELNGVVFDYDEGDKSYEVPIIISDGQQRSNTTPTIRVNIQDVNDNDPIFNDGGSAANDPKDCFFSVTEEKKANDRLMEEETIYAVDIDSGINSQLIYKLISVTCVPNTNYECLSNDEALKLFEVKTTTEYRAYVTAKKDLINLFGDYILEINAEDKGNPPRTSKSRYYRGCIADVNDNAPEITYPDVDYLIIRDGNGGITLADGSDIPLFHADDKDYGANAIVTFSFDDDDDVLFKFERTNQQNSFKFSLKDGVTFNDLDRYYLLNIKACDSGNPQQCSPKRKLEIYKLNTNPLEPIWDEDVREQEYQFTEGAVDDPMNSGEIPKAEDPNNIELPGDPNDPNRPLEPIYYYLIRGSDNVTNYFQIDSVTGIITLIEPLDCTVRTNWELIIQASNAASQANLPVNPLEKSLFTAKISVRDINDKSPKFTQEEYLKSVSLDNEQFLTVEAIDPDLDDSVTYTIISVDSSHVTSGQIDPQKAFEINQKTGALTFHSSIDASVSGYITLNVSATDKVGHTDVCFIKVYIISDKYKVPFTFGNSREEIVAKQNDIADIFTYYFEHTCIVGQIESANTTEVATTMTNHFVNEQDDSPVDADDIKKYKNNATRMKELSDELYRKLNVVLTDFATPTPTEDTDDSALIRTVLIAVCAVLGFLLLSMLALYIIKTRSMRKLIGNLTKATAPQEDKQNFALPNTNQYIDVGSNPVFNAEINTEQLDNASVSSADSSLIGIEDNPEFEAFYNNIVLKGQGGEEDDILKENPQLKAFVGMNHDDVNF